MALNHQITVSMPKEKISFKKGSGNTIYVYYTIKAYRRPSDGKPTSDEVCIGKRDINTGNLIPNQKYYELFSNNTDFDYTVLSVRTYGTFFLLNKIAASLNLINILKDTFPTKYKSMYIVKFTFITNITINIPIYSKNILLI